MLLREVCTLDVACCSRTTTITEAARLMRQHHTGDLIVVDDPDGDRTPVGILTDRDIVLEVIATGVQLSTATAGESMSQRLVVADAYEDVSVGLERMREHGVR